MKKIVLSVVAILSFASAVVFAGNAVTEDCCVKKEACCEKQEACCKK